MLNYLRSNKVVAGVRDDFIVHLNATAVQFKLVDRIMVSLVKSVGFGGVERLLEVNKDVTLKQLKAEGVLLSDDSTFSFATAKKLAYNYYNLTLKSFMVTDKATMYMPEYILRTLRKDENVMHIEEKATYKKGELDSLYRYYRNKLDFSSVFVEEVIAKVELLSLNDLVEVFKASKYEGFPPDYVELMDMYFSDNNPSEYKPSVSLLWYMYLRDAQIVYGKPQEKRMLMDDYTERFLPYMVYVWDMFNIIEMQSLAQSAVRNMVKEVRTNLWQIDNDQLREVFESVY